MDQYNVLSITSDPKDLDEDLAAWTSLTHNQRKRSDEECIRSYGMTNMDLYNILKKNSIDNEADLRDSLQEGTLNIVPDDNREEEFEISALLQEDPNIVIIDPFVNDDCPDYTLEDLEDKMNRYLASPDSMKDISDQYSLQLWGYNVMNMYRIMKNKFDSEISRDDMIHINSESHIITDIHENDTLSLMLRKLDCMCPKDSLLEEALYERTAEEIDKKLGDFCVKYDCEIPMVVPYLSPTEYHELTGEMINAYDYINVDSKKYYRDLTSYMTDPRYKPPEEQEEYLLSIGWNTAVEVNEKTIKFARDKQIRWFNENKKVQIIDLSNFEAIDEASNSDTSDLEPVYIVTLNHGGINSKAIRWYTKSNYSHAGLSLDEKMDKIYSFNALTPTGGQGFSVESLDFYKKSKDVHIQVSAIFISKKIKKKLKERIEWFEKNIQKTKYDTVNLFRIMINKPVETQERMAMVCSQFVDSMLKFVNIDLTHKPSNLVSPGDFERATETTRLYVLFRDAIEKYRPRSILAKVRSILKKRPKNEIITIPATEAVDNIFSSRSIDSIFVLTENASINQYLRQIQDILTPTSVIDEAKLLPVRIGKKGDLYIDFPKDLEREYQECHRLLGVYDDDNIEGIKHELAHLYYINIVLERRIAKCKNNDIQYKEYVNLRARVLNDFKKYFKVVTKKEKNFNFEGYLKNSEYYDKTIKIDRHTLKYAGNLITTFIASQGI